MAEVLGESAAESVEETTYLSVLSRNWKPVMAVVCGRCRARGRNAWICGTGCTENSYAEVCHAGTKKAAEVRRPGHVDVSLRADREATGSTPGTKELLAI